MIDFAVVLFIFFLQENAALVIGMNHENFATVVGILPGLLESFFHYILDGNTVADMTTQLGDAIHFVGLQGNFTILPAAVAALSAFVEKRVEFCSFC